MTSEPPDDKLDLTSGAPTGKAAPARPFLSVHFTCCGVYQRIYRSADGSAYRGHCPRCARPVTFKVGPGGSTARSFTVG